MNVILTSAKTAANRKFATILFASGVSTTVNSKRTARVITVTSVVSLERKACGVVRKKNVSTMFVMIVWGKNRSNVSGIICWSFNLAAQNVLSAKVKTIRAWYVREAQTVIFEFALSAVLATQ
jgi:hypothetical protein